MRELEPARNTTPAKHERPRLGGEKQTVIASLATVAFFGAFYLLSLAVGQVNFLRRIAIEPQHWESIYSVVTYAVGHAHPMHLAMNMGQIVLLAACATLTRGWKNYLEVATVVLIGSGLFTWVVGPHDALIIGASGITAGLASYLFVRSGLDKDLPIFALSAVFVTLVAIGIVSTLSSHNEVVSWHAHAGGLLAGIIFACVQVIREKRDLKVHSVVTF